MCRTYEKKFKTACLLKNFVALVIELKKTNNLSREVVLMFNFLAKFTSHLLLLLSVFIFVLACFAVAPLQGYSPELEKLSPDCLTCHNGSRGKHKSFCLLAEKDKCSRHILAISFNEGTIHNEGLHPRRLKVLHRNAISCTSCHGSDPHSGEKDPRKRFFSICRSCHSR